MQKKFRLKTSAKIKNLFYINYQTIRKALTLLLKNITTKNFKIVIQVELIEMPRRE